jgi:Spy/CpxP family protein refolding chaperone
VTRNEGNEAKQERTRHGFWFGVFVGGLAGALTAGTVVATATVKAAPSIVSALHFRGHLQDPEKARHRAEFATAWILGRVDATDAQQDEAKRIVDRTFDDLMPLVESHRANREEIHTELARAEIDPEALERIRKEQMVLIDGFSKELTEAVVELAGTLEPEQRAKLVQLAEEFHR